MIDVMKFWDKAAKKYAASSIDNMEGYLQTLERTRHYLTRDDRVLELGCGTGSTALLLAENVKHITASDISANMITFGARDAHEQNITNIDFVRADLHDDKFGDEPYDAVLALNLLHLLEDTSAAMQRIHGLLKPGGVFISKTVNEIGKDVPLKYRIIKIILPLMQKLGQAPYVKFMSIEVLENYITSAGFKIIESGSYPSRYIVAKKL